MFQNVIIRKANDPDPLGEQCLASLTVVFFASFTVVPSAIGLDSQTGGQATKVENVSCNGNLAAEVAAIKFASPKR